METGAVDLFSTSVYNCSKSYFIVNTGTPMPAASVISQYFTIIKVTIKYTFQ